MKQFMKKVRHIGQHKFQLSDFSQQDIALFATKLDEIQELVHNYPNSRTRKQSAQEIQEKIQPLTVFLNLLIQKLESTLSHFRYLDGPITEGDLAMKTIVRLANVNESRYALKTFSLSEQILQVISREGQKEPIMAEGKIWLIGNTDVIPQIDDKVYTGSEFSKVLTDIAVNGHPIIVCNSTTYCSDVLPSKYHYSLEAFFIPSTGLYNYIVCYLKDGPLMDAVTKFRAWIKQYGTDFAGFDEDMLFELIQNS